jgi:hypothetical protein
VRTVDRHDGGGKEVTTMNVDIDVDALQLLPGEEAHLGAGIQLCAYTCKYTCLITL